MVNVHLSDHARCIILLKNLCRTNKSIFQCLFVVKIDVHTNLAVDNIKIFYVVYLFFDDR